MKTKNLLIATQLILFALPALANMGDLGFRYQDGECKNSKGETGLNPSFFGQCSDLRGVVLSKLNLDGVDFSGSKISNSDLQKSSLKGAILMGVDFEGTILSGVDFSGAKIQKTSFRRAILKSVAFSETEMTSVDFTEADLGGTPLSLLKATSCLFVNTKLVGTSLDGAVLSGSNFTGADFTDANLVGADLSGATLSGVRFVRAKMERALLSNVRGEKVDLRGASLKSVVLAGAELQSANCRNTKMTGAKVDQANFEKADFSSADLQGLNLETTRLSGALYSKRTLLPFTAEKAQQMGMVLRKSASVFILWDRKDENLDSMVKSFTEEGMEVVLSREVEYKFDGTQSLAGFDAVIHLKGETYASDMATSGQLALVDFAKKGGTYIGSEWLSFRHDDQKGLVEMKPIIILVRNGGGNITPIKVVPTQRSHPLLEGIPDSLTFSSASSKMTVRNYDVGPVTVLMTDSSNKPVVAVRELGAGRVVGFSFACSYSTNTCLKDVPIQRLYRNAANLGL